MRVSFKTTTIKPIQTTQKEKPTTQKPRTNPSLKLTGRRRLAVRRKGQKSGNNSLRVNINPVKDRKVKDDGLSNPLNIVLKIAKQNGRTSESLEPDGVDMIKIPLKAAIKGMKEDNGIIKP